MIPKTLHFVWVGDTSKTPVDTIERWRQLNPDFQVALWGNADLKDGWVLANHMKHFWNRELCGVADCMRWEILYRHGGIALDADSEPCRAVPEWLLEPDVWCCWESEVLRPGLLSNGAVGSVPGHPFIGQIIEDLRTDDPADSMAWEFCGPTRLTMTWATNQYRDLTIWPSHLFVPDHFAGLPYKGNGTVIARQEWKSTKGAW